MQVLFDILFKMQAAKCESDLQNPPPAPGMNTSIPC